MQDMMGCQYGFFDVFCGKGDSRHTGKLINPIDKNVCIALYWKQLQQSFREK